MTNSGPPEPIQPAAGNSLTSEGPRPPQGSVFGAAWTIAIKNPYMTLAVFLIQLPLTYALSQVPQEKAAKISFQAHSWYEWLISGFVTFGVYRCALAAARNGKTSSFWAPFSEGFAYWGRNFRLSWVLGMCSVGLVLAIALPLWFIAWLSSELFGKDVNVFTVIVIGALALFGLVWGLRIMMRLTLSTGWLADSHYGVRDSAQEAARESWAMTKGRALGPIYGAFWMAVLGYALLILLTVGTYMVVGDGSEGYVSYETAAWTDIALSLPGSFVSVLTSCMFAVLYLRYSAPSSYPAK